MLKYVETKEAPAAIGPYSQGVVVNGFAFFSGQVPLSPQTGEVVGTTIEEQAEQVMKNIKGLLDSQNAAFTDVVKGDMKIINEKIEKRMDLIRELISIGRNIREEAKILQHSMPYMQNISPEIRPAPALL